ncbi:ferritin-like domain-containing protein [Pseudomassariella vexata]|uniref:Ferritin-like domain-domain-containing protein n=1 Tax=Pseudomassariella vexata TaxID=1141098 RepID=A0A1Y2EI10_9PEZI|nr:ferritin-like domain-containing protein [Pseudomassariella vexata]ORY71212.1 ferritin-like domain-domain-containing protein [Pseudomassariella vexata]
MPSIMKTIGVVAALAAVTCAAPAQPRFTKRQEEIYSLARRQTAAEQALGLTDVDVLQFALTLEWLEATFYQQGFAMFPDDQFTALGLNAQQVTDLKSVGQTEQAHVQFLQSAIAQAGVQPVQPCQYNFGFTDAKGMVGTAAVLENVGVSAYLGAAPILSDAKILAAAGSILTIESRHQSFIRVASGVAAVPSPFDTPLGPKAVFSLAAPFITSCPAGSNLALTAFPTLTMSSPAAGSPEAAALTAGTNLVLASDAAAGATFCGFTNAGQVGGTAFTPFTAAGGCAVPQNLAGITYLTLTSAGPADGVITDAITLAGPMVLQIS